CARDLAWSPLDVW
nr:immunoglobulin heavy chain junction region [Macaca mulatta]MOY20229.1 immunoglobulin heavy chain junction region [Macaca mulatta]